MSLSRLEGGRCYFISVAALRGVYIVIEQPLQSWLYLTPEFLAMQSMCSLQKVVTYMGGFGAKSMKPTGLMTTLPTTCRTRLQKTHRMASKRLGSTRERLYDVTPRRDLVLKTSGKPRTGWSKHGWVTGSKTQAASQTYPFEFCEELSEAVSQALSPAAKLAAAI